MKPRRTLKVKLSDMIDLPSMNEDTCYRGRVIRQRAIERGDIVPDSPSPYVDLEHCLRMDETGRQVAALRISRWIEDGRPEYAY